ncbi:MAG TPA: glycosyltransferase family 4 protein [Methylomirabilota bacterium]|nr:glycosyltransferase family 4 protein [Methylomirabilota bacterium]
MNTFTGFGQMFCEVFSGLLKSGVDLQVRPIGVQEEVDSIPQPIPHLIKSRFVYAAPSRPELLIAPLGWKQWPTKNVPTAYWTMIETTAAPKDCLEPLNAAKVVIVPCQANKTSLLDSGVTVPVFVVPLGISTEIFSPQPMRMTGTCVFGTGGYLAHSEARKDVGKAIRAFQRAFPTRQDVRLEIKTMPGDRAPQPNDSRIIVHRAVWDWHQLADWYASLTAFLCTSTGEGWGLMPHQAMATGRPVVYPNFAGLRDFCHGYPVWHRTIAACKGWGGWADPDESELVEQMLRIAGDREEARQIGLNCVDRAQWFSWDRTVRELLKVLNHALL